MAPLHLPKHQKKALAAGESIVFEDEASFRQDSTLHQTWARVGCQPLIPVTGARKSVKIFGAVDVLSARFTFARDTVFNAATYLRFLDGLARVYRRSRSDKVHLIQDNASYHKDGDVWAWFSENRNWLHVHQLPPYSPEYNATERLWHHTRLNGTHNRYFPSETELVNTLTTVFKSMQRKPDQIRGYLRPFC